MCPCHCLARLGVPLDLDLLADGQPADLWLVEVGPHALMVQVGQLQQQFALLRRNPCAPASRL